ncbi:HNH endonuclease [Pseudoalteromonas umbrosa]|uniref:HNH endonuclease n=1 Tax=Pseudoalteromonas umbrosa TaxID=3048489 RepID=UPI0024C42E8E|nr:HNH endonuclease [Pseudoalteromonas sp. B95]MDK1288607.1 HNH endonuclease [Pseudoalteromonas sp. B95]
MPLFDNKQLQYFGASAGAYSPVTVREATGDKSVTVDKFEKKVLETCYPLDSFTRAGGALPDGKATHVTFKHLVGTEVFEHDLAIKYPKANKNELRLYFNRNSEFYPSSEDVWFIFSRFDENIPYIGFMNATAWNKIGQEKSPQDIFEHDYSFDEEDEQYQKSIASPEEPKGSSISTIVRYNRNPKLAREAISRARYICEYDKNHTTFISGTTKNNFLEAHHLLPVSEESSELFKVNLDVLENIIALCPNCHRAIHYGDQETKFKLLEKLFNNRKENLAQKGIRLNFETLLQIYSVK